MLSAVTGALAPPLREADRRARDLRVMKRRATTLLVVMAFAFVAIVVFGDDQGGWGYAQAAAEGSLVGGLADWFAVTALFRHPLGLPIPHTAVIRTRKDQFGATLGSFVQDNFLTPAAVLERVRAAAVPQRLAHWLAQPAHADRVAGHAADLAVALADAVRDEDVHQVFERELRRGIDRIPVAPLAARGLRLATEGGRHQELFEAMVRSVDRFLADNRDNLRDRFAAESPWWLPGAMEDRVFDRLIGGLSRLLHAVATDPDHELRATFDARLAVLIDRLEHDEALVARGEDIKHELLEHPQLREWSASLWTDVKASLRAQTAEPGSALRRRLAEAAITLGQRLEHDPDLLAKAEDALESAVTYAVEHFEDEVSGMVTSTVSRWDADETSDKLELLLGRDLQFIRINGTVVGALAGTAIHAATHLPG